MNGDRVYRTARSRVWHWADGRVSYAPLVTACSAWPVDPSRWSDPVSVDMGDRCRGKGCAQAWLRWLERTIRAALADEVARLRAQPAVPGHRRAS